MAISRSDPFYSPKRRLVRAQKHLINLDRRIKRFVYSQPHKLVVELDPDGVNELHKIKLTKRLPLNCDDIAFEAVFTLRAVLDQTAYAAAIASGKYKPRNAYFPIADNLDSLENIIKGRCSDLPDEIKTLFRGFKPYEGGNDSLWALNKLRNSAHTALTTVGIAGATVVVSHLGDSAPLDSLNPLWDSVNNEIIFARGKRGQTWNYNVRPTLVIGFDAVEIAGRNSAINLLDHAFGIIKSILLSTEAECRRLNFCK
jgi:hypothetical protein